MTTTPEKIAQLRRLHADSTMVAGPHYRKAACEELPGLLDDLEAAQKREQVLRAEFFTLLNRVERQAERLALKVPPAHCDYVSKSGASDNLSAYAAEARAAIAATEVQP
jgi:hypothetical protein